VARERRVVTPDGHVWYVRRRWARRRPPWSRRSRPPLARVDADEELAAEEPVTPPVDALFTYYDSDLGEPGFDRRLRRPWFVELQRQGLTDAPRRVWRVRGWRRSGRLMDETATAIREGRIDSEHAAILFRQRRGGPPTGDRGGD
jgi:hypothetical protein